MKGLSMEVSSAFGSGLLGIQRGMQGLDRNAADIASASKSDEELPPVEALVESKVNRLQVEAGVSVIRTVDQTIGSLLDEMA
jgi:hypothetical protein